MNRMNEDIERVIQDRELFIPLAGSDVLITGATGLIGSMLMRTLSAANQKYGLEIRVAGQIRSDEKARLVFGDQYDKMKFVGTADGMYRYIIHTVSPTKSKYFIENPVETIKASVESTMEILEAAKAKRSSLVYLSSMEQYGVPYEPGEIMNEEKIGMIDHLNIRSSYSESKRLCECLCASYSAEYGVDVKIARLAQTFGAGVPLSDNRMPMQFARAVVNGSDIVLHTEGKSLSNMVYLTDAITGILTILEKGESGQAYNVCNDRETLSVRDTAEMVSQKVAGGRIGVRIEKKEKMGYAPDVIMYLDSTKLKKLGWKPVVDIETAYTRLSQYLQENSGGDR